MFYRELKVRNREGKGIQTHSWYFSAHAWEGGGGQLLLLRLMIPAQGTHESFQDLTRDLASMNS